MEQDKTLTRVGQQHFHVRIGPDEVDVYGVLEHPYAGPYYDIIIDDPEEAAETWINTLLFHIDDLLEDDEIEALYEDIIDSAEQREGLVGFELEELGFVIRLNECYGCIPRHNN